MASNDDWEVVPLKPSNLGAPTDNPSANPDALSASGAHALNALLFGHGPQVYGASKHPVDALRALISPDTQNSRNNAYIPSRDEAYKYLSEAEKQYPVSSFAGKSVGTLAPAILPSFAIRAPETALGRIAQTSALSGGYAAAQNPGNEEGKANPFQLEDRISQGIKGAAIGGGLAAGAELGSGLSSYLGKKATGFSPEEAKAYLQSPSEVKAMAKSGNEMELQDKAQDAIDQAKGELAMRSKLAENDLQSAAKGKSINLTGEYYGDTTMDAQKAIDEMRDLGNKSWGTDPTSGNRFLKDPESFARWKDLRQQVGRVSPEIDSGLSNQAANIEASKDLNTTRPLGFMGRNSDAAAMRQRADALIGQDNLDPLANKIQAANQLKAKSGLESLVGRGGLQLGKLINKGSQPAILGFDQFIGSKGGLSLPSNRNDEEDDWVQIK